MRIAILGTRGIPARYGGFETFAEELSARLVERGHEVTVYCRERHPEGVYGGARLVWCQEESHNMGAWSFIAPQLEEIFGRKAAYAGRDDSASPAVGSLALHKRELAAFLKEAFTL